MATKNISNRFSDIELENKPFQPYKLMKITESLPDINEALGFLKNRIPNWSKYVTAAETGFKSKSKSKSELTIDEYTSIFLLSVEIGEKSIYKLLKQTLRYDGDLCKNWVSYLRLFYSALEKLPGYSGECWQGTASSVSNKVKQDDKIIWYGVNSCSKSLDYIRKNCVDKTGTLLKISSNRFKDVSLCSNDCDTGEVLLPPGTILQVKSIGPFPDTNDKKITLICLEDVSDVEESRNPLSSE